MKRAADDNDVIDLTQSKRPVKLVQATLVPSAQGPRVGPPSEETRREAQAEPSTLSDALQQQMRDIVAPQLARFADAQERPRCAFNGEHAGEMRVAYREKYYDELARDFLLTHDASGDDFLAHWEAYHLTHARLRLLCVPCHQSMHPCFVGDKKQRPSVHELRDAAQQSVNDALQPYTDGEDKAPLEHEWLDVASWPPANAKGNYARQLDGAWFTLFCKNSRWLYVYQGKYGAERHHTLEEALRASYTQYRDTIRRCI